MRQRPNPWIAIPALSMGLLAGALGWVVTDVSCRQEGDGCVGWSTIVAILAFISVTVGLALVLVLVYRSLAEWQVKTDRQSRDSDSTQNK